MIRDIFHKRYKELYLNFFPNYMGRTDYVPDEVDAFFKQVAHIIFYDVKPILKNSSDTFFNIHKTFARELGVSSIGSGKSYEQICLDYLLNTYNVWMTNDNADEFIKKKISLIELSFGIIEEEIVNISRKDSEQVFKTAVEELNQRFRIAKLGFYYQNKMINIFNDNLTQKKILEPYWEILKDSKWQLVDNDIREAFERFNNNKEDAAFYAMRGLESVIKIISNDLGLTTGNEKGAANYIDNLSSKKNNIVDRWEADSLKLLFKEIRNPLGHGAGVEKQIELKYYQTKWVLDSCLVWVKSLVSRLE